MKLPFNTYDFFAYLTCGFVALVGVDGLLDGRMSWFVGQDMKLTDGLFAVLCAYLTGQLIASPAKWLFETILVERLLGRPSIWLFSTSPKWIQWVAPGYATSLPTNVKQRVLAKAREAGIASPGEDLFLLAWSTVSASANVAGRLVAFRDRSGFSRNVSFTFVCFAVSSLVVNHLTPVQIPTAWTISASVAGIGFLYRYLKFLRLYSHEVFVAFSRPED